MGARRRGGRARRGARVAYGTETFAAKDFVRVGLVLTVAGYALVLLFGATYWSWLGLLAK